ncbi:MAG: hypothetical protein AAF346_03220 [Pseudomonadota bacterium]
MQKSLIVVFGAILLASNAFLAYELISAQSKSEDSELTAQLSTARAKLEQQASRIQQLETRVSSLAYVLPSDVNSAPINFVKTFKFWVPTFNNPARRVPDQAAAEARFHEWLGGQFGGWSRWKVEGGEAAGTPAEGWFYQVSVPKNQASVTASQMKDEILKHFDQRSIYVVESRHQ